MKASPFSPLILVSLLLGLSLPGLAQSGQYTVQIDSMTAQDAAEGKVLQLKSQGQNAYWLKSNVAGQGIRYRVRIGRFPNRNAAQSFGTRLKQQGITSDFFVALFEGTSSPLKSNEQARKPETKPAPILITPSPAAPTNAKMNVNKPVSSPPAPATNKAAENQTPVTVAPTSQRQREVKIIPVPPNSAAEKPMIATPAAGSATKPTAVPTIVPSTNPPTNNAAPKAAPVTPVESKPLQSKPLSPTPLEEIKPPRDKKASTEPIAAPSTNSVAAAAAVKIEPTNNLAKPIPNSVSPSGATMPTVAASFQRFEERAYGYSFEHPGYWNGGKLNPEELQAQRIDAGAVFRSQEDVAFMNAIWNSLKNANSPAYDNNLIVDLVIKSLSSGTGLQGLSEVSRRMVQEGDQIKTFVDVRTLFRQPRTNQPLEFQGKAVIIRANTGILLVVTFYSKDSAPSMIAAADRIIGSARVP